MQVIHERCAALDVHKKTVVTMIMLTQADGSVQQLTRTFLTMTADLLALSDWLEDHNVQVVALESIGVFWRPVFNVLEEGRQVILVNAQHKQSGGKRLSGKTTKGNPYLRAILFEVAWAIAHTKDNYLSAFYHRMARRRGKHKAIAALAHKVLVVIYHILRTKKPYRDLGADYFDQRDRKRIEHHHVHRLEQLGYTVTLSPAEVA
jgi:Transposase IS116/IS110/IS902 family